MRPVCPKCKAELGPFSLNTAVPVPCPKCQTPQTTLVFPSLFREKPVNPGAALMDGESGCFFHPGKQAAAVCSRCGRFLCSLCEIEIQEGVVCPSCLAGKAKSEGEAEFTQSRTLYDNMAMGMAVFPMLAIWPTLVSAPLTWVVALKYWKSPISLVRRSRWRFPVALVISGLQMAGWAAFFFLV